MQARLLSLETKEEFDLITSIILSRPGLYDRSQYCSNI